jgi:hypothetical protein
MKQALVGTCIGLLSSFLLSANAWAEEKDNLSISFSYGIKDLLPSLIANSDLEFDNKKSYSDLWIEGGFQFSDKLRFEGALELTNQPHELIGTKFSRSDFPLSTGRFQKSVVSYTTDKLIITLGRDDMLRTKLRPDIFEYPIFADGIAWNYAWKSWNFKHIYQILPAESQSNQIFRRSISYHHLSRTLNSLTFGAGEYFILTGDHIGLDLKRFNPFLPYSLNSHDSFADYYPGFSGDSDNSLIKLFLDWRKQSNKVSINLYIDEFQIDAVDREVFNDAVLLSLSAENELNAFGQRSLFNWGFSAANPNFGQHPGPFTTTTIGAYPLFEYTPGMKNLYFFDATLFADKAYQLSLSGYTENWVNISELSPDRMNQRDALDQLDVHSDSRFGVELNYNLQKLPLRLGVVGWVGSVKENSSGIKFIFKYESNRLLTP